MALEERRFLRPGRAVRGERPGRAVRGERPVRAERPVTEGSGRPGTECCTLWCLVNLG